MKLKFNLIVLLASIAISFLLYGKTITGEFLWDDHMFVGRPQLRSFSYLTKLWFEPFDINFENPESYRPMLILSAILNFNITGESPMGFRTVNLLLNGIIVFLIFRLVYKLFSNKILALFSALIYAFLPIHTEVVAQVKSRDELLAALFILISWIFFLKGTKDDLKIKYRYVVISSLFFLFGLLSKEFIIVWPIVFLSTFFIQKRFNILTGFKVLLIYLPSIFVYLYMRQLAIGTISGPEDISFLKNPLFYTDWTVRIGTGIKAVTTYFIKIFAPYNLSATYAYNHFPLVNDMFKTWETYFFLGLCILLVYLFLNKKLRNTPITIGLLIFFIPIILYSNLIILLTDLFAERWAYLPSIGLSIVAGYFIERFYKSRPYVILTILVLVLFVYTALIWYRGAIWTTNEKFYKQSVIDAPNSAQSRLMLAQYFQLNADFKSAKTEIDSGLKILRHPMLVELAAIESFNETNYDRAKQYANEAIEKFEDSKPHRAHLILAFALAHEKEYKKSMALIDWILKKGGKISKVEVVGSPLEYSFSIDNPAIRFILAVNYYKLGKTEEAKKYFDWNSNYSEEEKINIIENF